MVITSLENEKVKFWVKLKQKKERDAKGVFIVEGEHLVVEAIKNGFVKELILLCNTTYDFDGIIHYVSDAVLRKISSVSSVPKIMAVCNKPKERELSSKLLLIDALQDPGNLGTIIRSAVAFNFETIVLGTGSVDLYNDKTIRATEGMIFQINIIKRDLKELVPDLRANGYQIIGTKVTEGIDLKKLAVSSKLALLIGNEGNGVNPKLLDMCDEYLCIPINEKCESLNASVAASILMYELDR